MCLRQNQVSNKRMNMPTNLFLISVRGFKSYRQRSATKRDFKLILNGYVILQFLGNISVNNAH